MLNLIIEFRTTEAFFKFLTNKQYHKITYIYAVVYRIFSIINFLYLPLDQQLPEPQFRSTTVVGDGIVVVVAAAVDDAVAMIDDAVAEEVDGAVVVDYIAVVEVDDSVLNQPSVRVGGFHSHSNLISEANVDLALLTSEVEASCPLAVERRPP